MPALHWSEWMWLSVSGLLGLVVLLYLWWLHRVSSEGLGERTVDLGNHDVRVDRSRPAPIEVAAEQRCPCCHGDLSLQEGLHRCPGCSTVLHWECHREFGCPILGCELNTQRKQALAHEKGEDPEDDGKLRIQAKEKA